MIRFDKVCWAPESCTRPNQACWNSIRFCWLPQKVVLGKIRIAGLQEIILGKIRTVGLQKVILGKIRFAGIGIWLSEENVLVGGVQ